MKAEVLKGHLDALLLATLEPGPRHGYAIIQALPVTALLDGKGTRWPDPATA